MGGCLERPLSVYGPLCVQASVPGRSSYLLKQAKFQSWLGAWGPGVGPHIVGTPAKLPSSTSSYPGKPQGSETTRLFIYLYPASSQKNLRLLPGQRAPTPTLTLSCRCLPAALSQLWLEKDSLPTFGLVGDEGSLPGKYLCLCKCAELWP